MQSFGTTFPADSGRTVDGPLRHRMHHAPALSRASIRDADEGSTQSPPMKKRSG
jgi:hypothetical protein